MSNELKQALEPFAKLLHADGHMNCFHDLPSDAVVYENCGHTLTAGDFRRAANAYASSQGAQEGETYAPHLDPLTGEKALAPFVTNKILGRSAPPSAPAERGETDPEHFEGLCETQLSTCERDIIGARAVARYFARIADEQAAELRRLRGDARDVAPQGHSAAEGPMQGDTSAPACAAPSAKAPKCTCGQTEPEWCAIHGSTV